LKSIIEFIINNRSLFQELFPSAKYKFKNEEDCYQLIITGPKVEDTGKYTIEIAGVSSTGFLNVDGKFYLFLSWT